MQKNSKLLVRLDDESKALLTKQKLVQIKFFINCIGSKNNVHVDGTSVPSARKMEFRNPTSDKDELPTFAQTFRHFEHDLVGGLFGTHAKLSAS
jgi:hypothetical protein